MVFRDSLDSRLFSTAPVSRELVLKNVGLCEPRITLIQAGGKTAVGRWVHLAATYDGQNLRLFENGVAVAEANGPVKTDVWPGQLHIGQYSAGPSEDFRVTGRIAGVKIYHRPLGASEIAEAVKTKPERL